jgi:phage tail sheath protein FI
VGKAPSGNSTGFTSTVGFNSTGNGNWGVNAQGTTFSATGNTTFNLTGGVDYSANGGMASSLSDIISSYNILSNPAEYQVNFLINGPSGGDSIYDSQAKANALISIAEARKDCVAVISPHKSGIVNITNSETQTTNVINFFDPITSSSYAVFDSGYKYMFDRFNNIFRYIPCNADVAGLMARTSINQYSWFSPAGASRGAINGAVKLAYNPSKAQRDLLYPKRINPIIFSPGAGIILYGDKTALSYTSAFDRINVRRLFLTIESTIERAARAQLFEFNDVITRSNFVNIVEPYLRDVKSKRGIIDFLVICDETNNTPDVIDGNQFRADIFVKPARSINFIGLTFVSTRTGVSFEEVVGNV